MRVKLKDICTKITDGSHFSPIDTKNGYPMLSIQDMLTNGFDYSKCKHISKSDYDSLVKNGCKPEKNDVLIAKDGSYLKEIFVVKEDKEEVVLSSIAILRPNTQIVNPHFLKYYLSTESIKDEVARKYVSGSVLKRIILKNFENIEINLPDRKTQDKIAEILSGIDEQINRNNEAVKKLQVLIHTKYSSEFESKNVPNGHIKNICLLPSGFSFKPEMYCPNGNYKLVTIKNVNDVFVNTEKTDKLSTIPNGMKKYCNLSVGDILMSLTGNVGRISIVTEKNNLLNQRVSVLKCDEKYKTYIYALLNSQKYQIIMQKISRGTSQKNLSPIDVENLAIFIPDNIEEFYNETTLYFNQMISIQQNTQSLLNLKSNILPLLINNQLTNMQCFSTKKGGTVDVT